MRLYFGTSLLLCLLAVSSGQRSRFPGRRSRSDTVDPSGVMSMTDRAEIMKTAAGLPPARSPFRGRALSGRELREIATAANETVQSDIRPNFPVVDESFAFGPQLLSTPTARNIGRAGRVFEETARQIIARNGNPDDDGVREVLDCPFSEEIQCDRTAVYRTITGVCNNLKNPRRGSSNTPFERSAPSVYADGISEPRNESVLSGLLPLPRVVSTTVHAASSATNLDTRFTQITMEFGQYVSHDIERFAPVVDSNGEELVCCHNDIPSTTTGCLPMTIPRNDPFFGRFNRKCMEFVRAVGTPPLSCKPGKREQLNQETAYLDGSAVYGSTDELSDELRLKKGGLLRTTDNSGEELLLQDTELRRPECRSQSRRLCFKAGDPRVNQQPALMSMHTLWLREHNRVAKELSRLNSRWDDEKLFQEARKIVSAEFQHVVYNEFLPVLVGKPIAEAFDFPAKKFGYNTDYQSTINAQIRSAFSAAGYRFGHSLVQTFFARNLKFENHFLRPDTLYQRSRGPSFVIENLFSKQQQQCDRLISPQLTNTLFEQRPGTGIDLAATNLHRGRDFGIPSYNVFRVICGFKPATNFKAETGGLADHTATAAYYLKKAYKHVDDIDLWTGAVSEKVIDGAVVGPTIACIIGRQFFLLKKGDRFFYENNDFYAKFPIAQLNSIRDTSFARIICDNTKTNSVQRNVFRYPDSKNPKVNCDQIPGVDLTRWAPCVDGGWSAYGSQTDCYSGFRFQFRYCNNPVPSPCGKPCVGLSFRYDKCPTRARQSLDAASVARRIAPKGVTI